MTTRELKALYEDLEGSPVRLVHAKREVRAPELLSTTKAKPKVAAKPTDEPSNPKPAAKPAAKPAIDLVVPQGPNIALMLSKYDIAQVEEFLSARDIITLTQTCADFRAMKSAFVAEMHTIIRKSAAFECVRPSKLARKIYYAARARNEVIIDAILGAHIFYRCEFPSPTEVFQWIILGAIRKPGLLSIDTFTRFLNKYNPNAIRGVMRITNDYRYDISYDLSDEISDDDDDCQPIEPKYVYGDGSLTSFCVNPMMAEICAKCNLEMVRAIFPEGLSYMNPDILTTICLVGRHDIVLYMLNAAAKHPIRHGWRDLARADQIFRECPEGVARAFLGVCHPSRAMFDGARAGKKWDLARELAQVLDITMGPLQGAVGESSAIPTDTPS